MCGVSQLPEPERIVIIRVSTIGLESDVAEELFHQIGVGLVLSLFNFAEKLVRDRILRIQIRRAADSLNRLLVNAAREPRRAESQKHPG